MFSPSDTTSSPSLLRVVDLIPGSDSREVDENSETSIAVNPVDPMQMFAGAFVFDATDSPFFISTDGGATWSIFGALCNAARQLSHVLRLCGAGSFKALHRAP